jgi:hypothetical protein
VIALVTANRRVRLASIDVAHLIAVLRGNNADNALIRG